MQISCIYNGKKLLLSQFLCSLTHVHTLSQRPFLACTLQYVKNEMTTYEMYFKVTKFVINIIILPYFRAESKCMNLHHIISSCVLQPPVVWNVISRRQNKASILFPLKLYQSHKHVKTF